MLQADLIHGLDMIAFEGWEYHKLPLESLEGCESNPVGGNLESGTTTLPGRTKQLELMPMQLNEGYDLLGSAE